MAKCGLGFDLIKAVDGYLPGYYTGALNKERYFKFLIKETMGRVQKTDFIYFDGESVFYSHNPSFSNLYVLGHPDKGDPETLSCSGYHFEQDDANLGCGGCEFYKQDSDDQNPE